MVVRQPRDNAKNKTVAMLAADAVLRRSSTLSYGKSSNRHANMRSVTMLKENCCIFQPGHFDYG